MTLEKAEVIFPGRYSIQKVALTLFSLSVLAGCLEGNAGRIHPRVQANRGSNTEMLPGLHDNAGLYHQRHSNLLFGDCEVSLDFIGECRYDIGVCGYRCTQRLYWCMQR